MATDHQSELERLQSEAVKRVRDMQERAQRSLNGSQRNQHAYTRAEEQRQPADDRQNNGNTGAGRIPTSYPGNMPVQQWRFNERTQPVPENRQNGPSAHNGNREARHMQQRSPDPPREPPRHAPEPHETREPPRQKGFFSGGKLTGGLDLLKMFNLKNMNLDSDSTLILLLLVMLSGEEADHLLLLALVYILL